MKNRYLLSMLLAGLFLYFALPHVTFSFQSEEGIFWTVWVGFCLLVIAGNLSAILYAPKKARVNQRKEQSIYKKVRSN